MKKTFISLSFIILIVLAVAFLTKPSDVSCVSQTKYYAKKQIEEREGGFQFALMEGLSDRTIERGIIIEDYIFFKNISFVYDGNNRYLGWAGFGNVFISN